jgi:hypothetical protein
LRIFGENGWLPKWEKLQDADEITGLIKEQKEMIDALEQRYNRLLTVISEGAEQFSKSLARRGY